MLGYFIFGTKGSIGFDFQYRGTGLFRLSGDLGPGQNPYEGIKNGASPGSPGLSTWFYPPYWYPLIVPFGLLPFQSALTIWKVINFSLLIVSTHLIARALAEMTHQKY